jgi:hypothetical protein
MALGALSELDRFKAGAFPPGYPPGSRTFYSPVDDVHGALAAVLGSAGRSVVVSMYGYDDPELNRVLRGKLVDENVFVQLTLDSTQAAGRGEKPLLAEWLNDGTGNSIAVGHSEKGAIMHLKLAIVDGRGHREHQLVHERGDPAGQPAHGDPGPAGGGRGARPRRHHPRRHAQADGRPADRPAPGAGRPPGPGARCLSRAPGSSARSCGPVGSAACCCSATSGRTRRRPSGRGS